MPPTLPSELHLRIIELAAEIDRDDDGEADSDDGDSSATYPLLKALSAVSTRFHKACRAHIWRDTYIDCASNEALARLLDLLRSDRAIAESILYLQWRVCNSNLWPDGIGEAIFRGDYMPAFDEEQRADHLIDIMETLPHLRSLNFDLCNESVHRAKMGRALPPMATLVPCVASLTRLEDMLVHWSAEHAYGDESDIVPLLQGKPRLRELTINGIQNRPGRWMHTLGPHLASLQYLRRLDLTNCACVTDEWAALDWTGPVDLLALDATCQLSPGGLYALVQRFQNTLRTLVIHHYLPAAELEPFRLPKLEALEVEGGVSPGFGFLRSFRGPGCPKLRMVELGDTLPVEDMVTMIDEGWFPALEEFALMETKVLGDADVQKLREVCDSKGIALKTGRPA